MIVNCCFFFGLDGSQTLSVVLRISRFIEASSVRVGTRRSLLFFLLLIHGRSPYDDYRRANFVFEQMRNAANCLSVSAGLMVLNARAARLHSLRACQRKTSVLQGLRLPVSRDRWHDLQRFPLPLETWFTVTLLMCESRKGISANQVKRMMGISYKTAWYLCHRIRKAMAGAHKPMLDGTIEMDETYVAVSIASGGKSADVADGNKEIVIGIRQRGGDFRFFHAEDVKSGTLAKYVQENVSTDVDVIMTDDFGDNLTHSRGLGRTLRNIKHQSFQKGLRPKGMCITTNTVESAFSLLKRGIMGTWHKISAKHSRHIWKK